MTARQGDFADFRPTTYLNCAYQGPFPLRTVERIRQATELKCHPERLQEQEYVDLPERVRSRIAALIDADADEVALTNSATQGVGIVAAGLTLQPGDEVVLASTNFPSNLFTWLHLRRLGADVRIARPADGWVRPGDLLPLLSPRTRVLALDWVGYATGAAIDLGALGELAHRHGAIFVVDGTQGVGAMELQLHHLPVDALAVAAYKWLLGPYGTGFVYLSRSLQERLRLGVINWLAVEGSEHFDDLPVEDFRLGRTARIFDVPETSNFLNLYALEASLEYVAEAGVPEVNRHSVELLGRLREGLRGYAVSPPENGQPSTILTFRADSDEATKELHARLQAEHIAVSLRHGRIRVSPYLYNDERDIDRLLSVIRGGGGR